MEVLYTITNKVGASTGQYSHYKEDLYSYAQESFGISSELHRKFMAIASEEKVSMIQLQDLTLFETHLNRNLHYKKNFLYRKFVERLGFHFRVYENTFIGCDNA